MLDRTRPGTELHITATRLVYIDHSCLDLFRSWAEQNASSGCRLVVDWDGLMGRHRHPAAPIPGTLESQQ